MGKLGSLRSPVRSVLVVDDEPDIVESIQGILEIQFPGVTVHTALSGDDALKVLAKQPVDVILSDYRMPGMDGLEFLRKARELYSDTPRILITAYPELELAMRAINEAQIQNFLTKPVSAEVLVEAVNAAFLKSRRFAATKSQLK